MPSPPGPLLICRVGDDRIALPSADVREVIPLLPVWRPPTLPRPLAGFINVRGEILPVLSPAALFEWPQASEPTDLFSHFVRLRGDAGDDGGAALCLLVDRVEDFVTPPAAAVRPVRDSATHNGTVAAEVVLEDGIVHLLSLERLLDEGERARIAALTEEAARRAAEWATGTPA
jgi:purine-binding chemotaxis protein CheW